jgi:hypothetical protein
MDDHTLGKHKVLREYLKAWYPIVVFFQDEAARGNEPRHPPAHAFLPDDHGVSGGVGRDDRSVGRPVAQDLGATPTQRNVEAIREHRERTPDNDGIAGAVKGHIHAEVAESGLRVVGIDAFGPSEAGSQASAAGPYPRGLAALQPVNPGHDRDASGIDRCALNGVKHRNGDE